MMMNWHDMVHLQHVYYIQSTKQCKHERRQPSSQCQNTNLKAGALLSAAAGKNAAALMDCIAIMTVTVATPECFMVMFLL
jgi:hypothetical protein